MTSVFKYFMNIADSFPFSSNYYVCYGAYLFFPFLPYTFYFVCFALYHRFIFLGCIGLSFIFFCFEFIFVIYFLLLRIYLASVLLYLLSRFDLAKGFLLVFFCFARRLFDFDSSAAFLLHRAFSLHTPRAISFYSAVF